MYIGEITELSAPGCGLSKETFNLRKCTCPCKWARNWSIFCLIKSNQSLVPIIWIHYLLSSGGYASIERFKKKLWLLSESITVIGSQIQSQVSLNWVKMWCWKVYKYLMKRVSYSLCPQTLRGYWQMQARNMSSANEWETLHLLYPQMSYFVSFSRFRFSNLAEI